MENAGIEEAWRQKNLEIRRAADEQYADVFRYGDQGRSVELEKDYLVYGFLQQVYAALTDLSQGQAPQAPQVDEEVLEIIGRASAIVEKAREKLAEARSAADAGDMEALEAVQWDPETQGEA